MELLPFTNSSVNLTPKWLFEVCLEFFKLTSNKINLTKDGNHCEVVDYFCFQIVDRLY